MCDYRLGRVREYVTGGTSSGPVIHETEEISEETDPGVGAQSPNFNFFFNFCDNCRRKEAASRIGILDRASVQRFQVRDNFEDLSTKCLFRIYYEMWMALVFFLNLVYIPLSAAFGFLLNEDETVHLLLNACCLFDIFMNFCTGYRLPSLEVEMNPRKIAKLVVVLIFLILKVEF